MENIELAPAAGSGIGKQVAAELLRRPGFVERMADVIHNALTANRRLWDKEGGPDGKGGWVQEPDTKAQLQAFFGILSHMEGDPVKRILHQHSIGGQEKPVDMLRDSPALLEAVEHEVEKAKFRSRKQGGAAAADPGAGDLVHSEDVPN